MVRQRRLVNRKEPPVGAERTWHETRHEPAAAPLHPCAPPARARNPVSPSSTASALPPTSLATTGRPAAIASTIVFGNPSLREQRTATSNAWFRFGRLG